jgi:hypothetical protein
MAEQSKRIGRPARPAKPGTRAPLGLKVRPEIKARIDQEAAETGRTQSQVAEVLMERALNWEEALGSPELPPVALLMASAFALAGQRHAHPRPASEWLQDRETYREAVVAVLDALMRHAPAGYTRKDLNQLAASIAGRLESHLRNEEAAHAGKHHAQGKRKLAG